jgi:hypothetical protein
MPRKHNSPIDKAKAYEVIWPQVHPLFDAARIVDNACFIYVIGEQDDGSLKIGLSKDPIGRLRTMQTGNPRRLRIEHVLLGNMATEKLLHELWEPFAVVAASRAGKPDVLPGTEWFKPEARTHLAPIVEDAARRQVAYIFDDREERSFDGLERIVRDAHADSGFVARGRDEVWLLGQGSGYVVQRRSRI